jgi:hypothetical protein
MVSVLSDLQATQAAAVAIQALVAAAVVEIQTLAVSITSNPEAVGVHVTAEQINTLAMDLQTAVAKAFPPAPTGSKT